MTRALFLGTAAIVAGLPDSVTEEVLRDLFAEAGTQVAELTLPRDRMSGRPRGFAFVKLGSGSTSLETAAGGVVLYDGATASYLNVLDIRMQDGGLNVVTDGGKYWRTIIEYNPSTSGDAYDAGRSGRNRRTP